MKVQQVGFYSEGIGAEGGTIADISDGIKALAVDDSARDVNAIGGSQLFITAEVDGGHGVLVSVTAPAAGRSSDGKNAAQKVPRLSGIATLNQSANLAAGDGDATNLLLRIGNHFKSEFFSELRQTVNVALSLMSKMEIVALVHLVRLESLA